jgi:uncharacterized protein (DUF885 family)
MGAQEGDHGAREGRQRRDGAAFDLMAFHADVLVSGPVGLDLLRETGLDGDR